ncbi:MAG: response regulator transcription factor [Saprospiraceae bacterium]|nr:response regulator transcription factor [Saprospiraceae bacterium]
MKVLIVEDNQDLADNISNYLEGEGYVCSIVGNVFDAENRLMEFEYDVIILDIMLPDGQGLDILRTLKGDPNQKAGVIIISAKNALDDRLLGLDLGADDYLTKPFHLSELNARLKAIYRRRNFEGQQLITFNEIEIDPETQEVQVNNELITLTKKEYELLLYFIANKNRVLTKQNIAEHLWGDHVDMLDSFDFVYQHIKNLRKKLNAAGSEDYLSNVYGMGYKMKSQVS